MLRHLRQQRGDTIIEVLFAITVFSLVAVGGLSIMNQGSAVAERSLETTLVRDQIDGQVDALRFLHDAYITAYTGAASPVTPSNAATATAAERWRYIVDTKTSSSVSAFTQTPGACRLPSGSRAFAINPGTMNVLTAAPVQAPVYAKINSSNQAEGLWIEALDPSSASDGSGTRYVEFYVRACWNSVGQSMPMTIGTVVRLYEPVK